MRSRWVAMGLCCLLPASASPAGQSAPALADLFENATRPVESRGLAESVEASVAPLRFEPRHLRGVVADRAQPAQPTPQSRSWPSRHPALVGFLAGAAVGTVAAATAENNLFCSGGDESCALHSPGLKIVGVGVIAAFGGLAGFLFGLTR